jgi:hypothetical protein
LQRALNANRELGATDRGIAALGAQLVLNDGCWLKAEDPDLFAYIRNQSKPDTSATSIAVENKRL